jgi:diguanylate cyclase (GGDEF)-like protein
LALALLGVPGLIDLIGYARGIDHNPIPLATAGTVLCVLVFARVLRILHAKDSARREHAASERRYRSLAVYAADAVLVLGADGRVSEDARALGVRASRVLTGATAGTCFADLFVNDRLNATALFQRAVNSPYEVCEGELMAREADGGDRWIAARLVNLLADPDVHGVIVDLQDVTDRHQAEVRLEHQALHDALTGLANRSLFHDRVDHALARRARTGSDVAVMYLDLDGFKTINDSLGHEAGDELLRSTARRIAESVREGDTAARLGGDEFGVLIEGGQAVAEAAEIADRILHDLRRPLTVQGHEIAVTTSIGIARSGPQSTASELLRDADTAMYRAKATGRARWVYFDATMRSAPIERLRLESDLGGALERHELRVMYQPVTALDDEGLVGGSRPSFAGIIRTSGSSRPIASSRSRRRPDSSNRSGSGCWRPRVNKPRAGSVSGGELSH